MIAPKPPKKSDKVELAGKLTVEIASDTEKNIFDAKVQNEPEDLADILFTKEEQAGYKQDTTIRVYLQVKDIREQIEEKERQLIQAAAQEGNPLLYLDIQLMKQIGTEPLIPIEKTNGALKISLRLPENRTNHQGDYKVVRLHEGYADLLDAQWNETTGELSFETDTFSIYAVIDCEEVPEKTMPEQAVQPEDEPAAEPSKKAVQWPVLVIAGVCGILALAAGGIWMHRKKQKQSA